MPTSDQRAARLTAARQLKMARSAHAYMRGNTEKFYDWLEGAAHKDLPDGPPIWICGDCHMGNLGPVASLKGRVGIQIRDLDQTVIGNPAHDIIRLGLSLSTAARGSDLPGVTTAHMLEELMAGYQEGLAADKVGELDEQRPRAVHVSLRRAIGRRWRELANERIEDVRPTIPLGKRFWPLDKEEREGLSALFETEDVRHMLTAAKDRDEDAEIELVDAAYWMKGCSSLGRLRYAALVRIGNGGRPDHALIDLKEAVASLAPRAAGADMPRSNSERVVTGARALSPYLGRRMVPARMMNRGLVVRELMPQDLKLDIENLSREEAMLVARYLGRVVGHAHGRQMDDATTAAWSADLTRRWPKGLDAPFWLWNSIVDLAGIHERAYLEHCRRYALAPAA